MFHDARPLAGLHDALNVVHVVRLCNSLQLFLVEFSVYAFSVVVGDFVRRRVGRNKRFDGKYFSGPFGKISLAKRTSSLTDSDFIVCNKLPAKRQLFRRILSFSYLVFVVDSDDRLSHSYSRRIVVRAHELLYDI